MQVIGQLCERALFNMYDVSGSFSGSVMLYRGEGNETMTVPCVVVASQSATEEATGTGNYRVVATVITYEAAEDTDIDDDDTTLASEAFDILADNSTTLGNFISGLHVYDVFVTNQSLQREQDCWNQTVELNIICRQTS